MNTLSLRTKLMSGFLVGVLLVGAVSVFALLSLRGELRNVTEAHESVNVALEGTQEELPVVVVQILEAADVEFFQAVERAEQVGVSILSALLIALVVSIIFSFSFSRTIVKPISELIRVAQRISEGKFDERVHVASKDEIGELANAFNSMTESLLETQRLPKNILRSMKDSLFVVDTAGRITEVNRAAIETLGYTKEELLEQPIARVFGYRTITSQKSTPKTNKNIKGQKFRNKKVNK